MNGVLWSDVDGGFLGGLVVMVFGRDVEKRERC